MATGDTSVSGLGGDGFSNGELPLARQAAWSEKGTGMSPAPGAALMYGPINTTKDPMVAGDIVVTLTGDYPGAPTTSDAILRVVADVRYLPREMSDRSDAMDHVKVVGRIDPSLMAPEAPGTATAGVNVSKEHAVLPAVGGIQRGGTASIVNNSRKRVEVGDRLLALPPTNDSPTAPGGRRVFIVTPMGPHQTHLNFTAVRNALVRRLSTNNGITDQEVRLGIAAAVEGDAVLPFSHTFVDLMGDLMFHSFIIGAVAMAKTGLVDINVIIEALGDSSTRVQNAGNATDAAVAQLMRTIEPHMDSESVAATGGVPIHDIVLATFGGMDEPYVPFNSPMGNVVEDEPLTGVFQDWVPKVIEMQRRYQDTLDRFTIATAMSRHDAVSPGAPPPKIHCLLNTA